MTSRFRLVFPVVLLLISASGAQEIPLSRSLDALHRHGFLLSLDSTTDSFAVGLRHGTAETWLDFSADVQLEKMWPKFSRTRAFVSVHANGNWNSGLGGAVQSPSGIQSRAGLRTAEIWVERTMASGVRLRAGRIDANPDFAYIENAGAFVNTADGYNPSFFLLPNYNATQPGTELLLAGRQIRLNLAAFAHPQGTGLLIMQEVGTKWKRSNYSGRLAIGAWQSTGMTAELNGTLQPGVRGAYVVAEQTLWHAPAGSQKSIAAFFQSGVAPAQFTTFMRHAEAGLIWKAPVGRRIDDAAGVSFARGDFSAMAIAGPDSPHESVWEGFYRIQLSSRMSLSPDLQYITNPGGAARRNLLAVGLRMNINLLPHRE